MPDDSQTEPQEDTTAATAESDTEDSQDQSPTPKKPTETVEFWKAKARDNEKRAKENSDAAKRLKELEDAQKTELQREREAREAAEKAAAELRAERELTQIRAQVSKSTGIPAEVLRGNTQEEIEDHAQSLKALLPEPRKPGQVPAEGRTVSTGSGDPAQQFAELIRNARK